MAPTTSSALLHMWVKAALLFAICSSGAELEKADKATCTDNAMQTDAGDAFNVHEEKTEAEEMRTKRQTVIGAQVWLKTKRGSSKMTHFLTATVEEVEVPVDFVFTYTPGTQRHVVSYEDYGQSKVQILKAEHVKYRLFPKYAVGQKVWIKSSSEGVVAAKVTEMVGPRFSDKKKDFRTGKTHGPNSLLVTYVHNSNSKWLEHLQIARYIQPREGEYGSETDMDNKAKEILKHPSEAAQDLQAALKEKKDAQKQALADIANKYTEGKKTIQDGRCPDEFQCCPLTEKDLELASVSKLQAGSYCVSEEGMRKAWAEYRGQAGLPWLKEFPCNGFTVTEYDIGNPATCDRNTPGVVYDEGAEEPEVPEGELELEVDLYFHSKWTKVEG
eukprot:CAMPEP_0198502166 /NCGR_PEP_ID=MMETSP1462-20131121/9146_1 /TAXON_ID=1333877 /ORGANISM="Brandtodinium nutriculum, Strain RCC3387" /LENGTH=385 /DNA_ID=CAMNT_0044231239 /DNA_START=89 /DNA_END=1246 /DNA_ORIENTATION=+